MITSFSVSKEYVDYIEYMKDWCKKNGVSKSHLIMKLIASWVKEKRKCTTSTR